MQSLQLHGTYLLLAIIATSQYIQVCIQVCMKLMNHVSNVVKQ